jgi:hypothetical protein
LEYILAKRAMVVLGDIGNHLSVGLVETGAWSTVLDIEIWCWLNSLEQATFDAGAIID